jgi:hypothetical protein
MTNEPENATLKILREIRASQHSMQATRDAHTKEFAKPRRGLRSLDSKVENIMSASAAHDVAEISGIRQYAEQIDARVQVIEDQLELTPSEPSE